MIYNNSANLSRYGLLLFEILFQTAIATCAEPYNLFF